MVLMGLHALFVWIAVSDLSTPGFLFQRHAWLMERGRVSARLPTYFLLQESRQRARPCYPRPCASLQAACAVKLLELCGKTYFALRSNTLPQVRARSCCTLRCSSQPQELAVAGVGTRGDTECGQPDSFFVKLIAASVIRYWARCQFRHKSHRPSVPIPFGCACGMRFRLRETLPQDSIASFSSLPPFV